MDLLWQDWALIIIWLILTVILFKLRVMVYAVALYGLHKIGIRSKTEFGIFLGLLGVAAMVLLYWAADLNITITSGE